MTNSHNAPYTINDLAAHRAITHLQETARDILGDTADYNRVVAKLAHIENLIMTPGSSEEIEAASRRIDKAREELRNEPTMSDWAESRRRFMTPDTIAANERLEQSRRD